jgi:hypothetical protein
VGVAILYVVARFAMALSTSPNTFPDTSSYTLRGSKTVRPYGLSALFDVLGQPGRIVIFQTFLGALAALTLANQLRRANSSMVPALILLLLTLTKPISQWDRIVLSEALTYAVIMLLASAAIYSTRKQHSITTVALTLAAVIATALIRETAYIVFGLTVVVLIFIAAARKRQAKFAAIAVGSVLIGVAGLFVSLRPGNVIYGPDGQSLSNFRSMNVIGQKILPDPYLRTRMEAVGLPKTEVADRVPRYAMDESYRLYAIPGMLEFANNFPVARYGLTQLSRPLPYGQWLIKFIDADVVTHTAGFEEPARSQRIVPVFVEKLVWGWTGALHFTVVVAIAIRALLFGSRKVRKDDFTTWFALVAGVGLAGAFAAVTFDAMEPDRHALPFLVVSRVACVLWISCWLRAFPVENLLAGRRDRNGSQDGGVANR